MVVPVQRRRDGGYDGMWWQADPMLQEFYEAFRDGLAERFEPEDVTAIEAHVAFLVGLTIGVHDRLMHRLPEQQ